MELAVFFCPQKKETQIELGEFRNQAHICVENLDVPKSSWEAVLLSWSPFPDRLARTGKNRHKSSGLKAGEENEERIEVGQEVCRQGQDNHGAVSDYPG